MNYSQGVVLDTNFVGDLQMMKKLFDMNSSAPVRPEMEFLRKQKFNVTFFSPYDRPIPSTHAFFSFGD